MLERVSYFLFLQKIEKGELEEVMNEGMNEGYGKEEVCYGKKCTANEHCCSGHACVDVDGGNHNLLLTNHIFTHIQSYSLFFIILLANKTL